MNRTTPARKELTAEKQIDGASLPDKKSKKTQGATKAIQQQ
jgi:hypothetical protein